MFKQKNLLWSLVEDDIDNSTVFFPAGTPLTTLQSKRHYEMLKVQQHRQKERLIAYQVHELEEYEHEFISQNGTLQPDPKSVICEEISGARFLHEKGEIIGKLLSDNYTSDPDPSKDPKSLKMSEQQLELLSRIKKKYERSVDKILERHQIEYEDLLEYQKRQQSAFSIDVTHPKPELPVAENKSSSRRDDRRIQKRRKSLEPDQCTEISKRKKTANPTDSIPTTKEDKLKNSPLSSSLIGTGVTSQTKPKELLFSKLPSKAPPAILPIQTKGKAPPTVSSSAPIAHKPLEKKNKKIPKKHLSGPPLVSTLNKDKDQTNTPPKKNSLAPLFNNNPKNKNKSVSLTDKGVLRVVKGPDRVVICGRNGVQTAYGDPKDYDDAINGSKTRQNNPVYKRMMNGVQHLFYRTNTGQVVTIGPVSKVQPTIHKFFLSM